MLHLNVRIKCSLIDRHFAAAEANRRAATGLDLPPIALGDRSVFFNSSVNNFIIKFSY